MSCYGIENVGRRVDGEAQDVRNYSLLEEETVITVSWQLLIAAHGVTREDSRQWGYKNMEGRREDMKSSTTKVKQSCVVSANH